MSQTPATEQHVGAVFRLDANRRNYPELVKAEAQARLELAAAIIDMDDAFDAGRTAINEQIRVEQAKEKYALALADFVRGKADSSI